MKRSYVPPALRKPESTLDKLKESERIVSERTDIHFPSLTSSAPVMIKKTEKTNSYADKAEEWRLQRLEIEHNERVEAELAKARAERASRRKDEDELLMKASPFRKRTEKVEVAQTTHTSEKVEDDGWTTIVKKTRQPRKSKVDFEEVPEDESIPSENDDYEGGNDKDSLWN